MNRTQDMSINIRKIIGALALLILFTSTQAQEKKERMEIVGYYPNWQQYKRGGMFHQNNLDFSKYTIIEYAFMGLDESGNVYLVDPWGDNKIISGDIDWDLTTDEEDPVYIPYTNMISLAHKEGTKVMVSIGGWTLSTNFPQVAADPDKRARFAESCVEVCRKYNFDGIDIDWEFPGASPGNGCEGGPEDKENLNLMFDVIRDSLNVYEKEVGHKMLLTAAFHSVPYLAQQVDWEHTAEVLDYVNLFGYDFYGAWYKEEAIPQSPLYAPAEGHGDFGVNQADGFLLLTEVYGVPAEKIILGIGFYGRSIVGMKGGPALYAPHDGAVDLDNFPLHEGSPAYFEIIEKYPEYNVMWDEDMKVPYMLGKTSNSFVGYDDLVSVQYKAAFICQQGAAGCLIWEVSQDVVEKPIGSGKIGGTPLIDVINEVFENYEQTGSYEAYGNKIELRDPQELIDSYHRRDAQVDQKQAGYSQDEQPAAGTATISEADTTKKGNVKYDEKEIVDEDTRDLVANNSDINDDDAVGIFNGVTAKKNELRDGAHFFEPGELDILFGKNSTELTAAAKQNIRASAKFVVATEIPVILTGYSSSDGNAEYNLKLAKKRVAAVKAFLIESIGFYAEANKISINANEMIKTEAAGGETQNFGNNLSNNRRVTISYKQK
jgi:GH18 family chitinase/outer membrane protein OmpA-like peptidoglycan-associated protein